MQSSFTVHIDVLESDIDTMGHVNNVVYVRWAQEVAQAHWVHNATEEMRLAYSWVVLRHEVDYRNPAHIGDNVVGSTWVGDHHGARFDRFVKIHSASGPRIYAELKTTWCLLDARSKKPLRIPAAILQIL